MSGKATGTALFWDSTGTQQSCDLDASGTALDVAVSDVFAPSCSVMLPAGVGDFAGPVEPAVFIAPAASTQKTISSNAAYFVFGFGAAGMVNPWNDESQLFVRNATASTQIVLGAAIGVPANRWKGIDAGSSGNVLTNVANAVSPQRAIGILMTDSADANRNIVRPLAFQPSSSSCGQLPDSTAGAFDKANVRSGEYPLWGRVHYFAHVGGGGAVVGAGAATVVGNLTGMSPAPAGFNELDVEIASHWVPQCSMKVTRTSEMGALAPFSPADPCTCYFEQKTTGATSCTSCTSDASCGSSTHCHHGFCE
jgi:hypothetical protein